MAQTLYLDAVGGVAGDMLLAALVDAGAPLAAIQAGLPPVEGLRLDVQRVQRCGVDATLLTVTCPPPHAHRKLPDVLALVDTGDMPSGARNAPTPRSRFSRRPRAGCTACHLSKSLSMRSAPWMPSPTSAVSQ